MEKYNVTGMTCAACQAHVEKAVLGVGGVENCAVSLLTNTMTVEGTASPYEVIKAVENAGYGASVIKDYGASSGASRLIEQQEEALKDRTTPLLKKRLIVSVALLLVLMYFSMGVSMFGFPAPAFISGNMLTLGIIEMLLSGIIMVINQQFFISGFRSLFHGAPNMDTLVAMGSGVSFLYSFVTLIRMSTAMHGGAGHDAVMELMNEIYFESSAMIVTLITIGKMLESLSKGRTTDALKSLMKLSPKTAVLLRDGAEVTVDIDEVRPGDIFVVRPGQNIPVDGVIIEGSTAVNESALTGESIPVDKAEGDTVSAATVNQSGYIRCRATRVGEDTTLSQIIKMVSDSASTKAPIARTADRISGIFVPGVLCVAAAVFVIWMLIGATAGTALTRAVSVLVVSCPCALGLATPVAIMVGNGVGAKNGILFKTSAALEETGRIKTAVLDKTGTITTGMPSVTDVIPAEGVTEEELLRVAFGLESRSEHPLSGAVVAYAEGKGMTPDDVTGFAVSAGNGLFAEKDGVKLYGGNARFISGVCDIPRDLAENEKQLALNGKTPLYFASGDRVLGIIAVADRIREKSAKAVKELRNMGIHVVMLTGDKKETAEAVGREAGVDEVIAEVMPGAKEAVIRRLKEKGKVAMVGDGINDAPALTSADIGIAIGAGTDVAIDAADVVLMKSTLEDVCGAVRLSRRTLTNIHENLFWAFIYNILLIPVAAGAYAFLGLTMSPMIGAAAMSISSFTVCMNALRLNLVDPHDPKHDRHKGAKAETDADGRMLADEINKTITIEKEKTVMKKTIRIEGMMCGHCEAAVKRALESIEGVSLATASHTDGIAVVELTKDVPDEMLRKAVEDRDYKVTAIN